MPATHYYTLVPPSGIGPGTTGESGDGVTLGVESFAVDPPYDQDRLVYRESVDSTEVGFYNYHRWASPLGRLVQQALVGGLAGSAGIGRVEPAASLGDYDARLRGRVLYLEEAGSEVRLAVHLKLEDAEGQPLWSDTLSSSAGVDPSNPSELASRAREAFSQIVDAAGAALSAALDPVAPGPVPGE